MSEGCHLRAYTHTHQCHADQPLSHNKPTKNSPIIERWAQRAEDLYPTNKCLTQLRRLVLSHLDAEEDGTTDAAAPATKAAAGTATITGGATTSTAAA